MLAFYVVTATVAALLIGGFFAYGPLRLRYAIYRVRSCNDYEDKNAAYTSPLVTVASKWMRECLEAARKGNRQAMMAVLDHPRVVPKYPAPSVFYLAVQDQPKLALDALSEREDTEVFSALAALAVDVHNTRRWSSIELIDLAFAATDAEEVKNRRIRYLQDFFHKQQKANDNPGRQIAGHALDFMRERFAKELAQAAQEEQKR
jgi:alpha-mannosidase